VALLPQALQLFEGAEPGAFGGLAVADHAVEHAAGGAVGGEKGGEGVLAGFQLVEEAGHELGFDEGIAAPVPVGLNQGFDQKSLFRAGGAIFPAIVAGEGFEPGGIFAGDDGGTSVHAVLESVEARGGFTRIGTRSGGLLGVEEVGRILRWSSHTASR